MAKRQGTIGSGDFSFETASGGPAISDASVNPAAAISGAENGERFDPAIHATGKDGEPSRNSDGSYRRKRGSGNARTAKGNAPPLSIEPVKNILLQIHAGLSQALKSPELALYDAEAENLGAAIVHLSSQYGGKIDPKAEAWLRMTIVAASVYAPRMIQMRERQAKENREKRTPRAPTGPVEVPHPFAVEQNAPNIVS